VQEQLPNTDVAKNIRVIEWLKADMLTSLSALFKSMIKGSESVLLDALASLVISCYVLSRRLGINFTRLDLKIEAKLRESIENGHEVEKHYGDLSRLLSYFTEEKSS